MDTLVNLVFGKKVELKNITSLKNVVFPKECDIISLPLVEELENVIFPDECTVIYLESCKRIKNVRQKIVLLVNMLVFVWIRVVVLKTLNSLNLKNCI